jgi:YidC/Oxa1 family membrane protein insertase
MNIIFYGFNILLGNIFNLTGDWGIAIIFMTVLVRVLISPMSIKQKISIQEQQETAKIMQEIQEKYKNDKKKLEAEMTKYQAKSARSMFGCMVSLLQLPIIFTLYNVILKMPVEAGTLLIPWAANIKLADSYYVIPVIYALTSLSPNLLQYIKGLKLMNQPKANITNIIMSVVFSLLIAVKAPVALGIYFITSGLFSLIEEIGYRLYFRKKLTLSN